jgi:hypothetical protein
MNPVRVTKAKKKEIHREIRRLLAGLRAGTIDRKKLESGLKKIESAAIRLPDHGHTPTGPKG